MSPDAQNCAKSLNSNVESPLLKIANVGFLAEGVSSRGRQVADLRHGGLPANFSFWLPSAKPDSGQEQSLLKR